MSRETHMSVKARSPRMKRKALAIAATFACLLAYGALVALSHFQPWLIWPALGFAILVSVFACLWMLTLDEAAQQAHYISWFWGGSAGLLVSTLIFAAAILRPEAVTPILAGFDTPFSFAVGVATGVIPPTIGYGAWWIALWLRRG